MKQWFVSDTHFSHSNILKYENRPFKTVEEMNERLIQNWNNRVAKEDIVYFLGDFNFRNSPNGNSGEGLPISPHQTLSQLNGYIQFVQGNHDRNNGLNLYTEFMVISVGGIRIKLVHKPEHTDEKYQLNICGHVHSRWSERQLSKDSLIINVAVEVRNYAPTSLDEVMSVYWRWKHKKINVDQFKPNKFNLEGTI